jgi:hypothetical protein
MTTSPTSTSAPLSNAAKADYLDADGNFTVADLLANDAGGANASTFFFGSGADATNQAAYMLNHGITLVSDVGGIKTYHFDNTTVDSFQYSVQIGHHGTWTTASVDLGHAGDSYFSENFESYTTAGTWADATAGLVANGWSNLGAHDEVVNSNYTGPAITGAPGNYWLDTQASPGPIDISHQFTDTTGGNTLLSFDIGVQSFGSYSTASNATFDFKVDGVVIAHIVAADLYDPAPNLMHHFDVNFNDGAAGLQHNLEMVDTSPTPPSNVGFALDNVAIHDWHA